MSHKRLSVQEVEQMKSMVQKGVAPEDIANHFEIAISSVHNYKARFKQEGIQFPNLRGKRPIGSVGEVSVNSVSNQVKSVKQEQSSIISAESSMNFVVNGVQVRVAAGAKNVNISNKSIEINF
jgi:hypothetical protein